MSLDGSTESGSFGRVGILLGLAGLGVGVTAALTGAAVLGLAAGVLALVGPATMLREVSRLRRAPKDAAISEAVVPTDDAGFGASEGRPFHMDSELLTGDYYEVAVRNRLTAARRFLKPLSIVQLHIVGAQPDDQISALTGDAILETLRDCDTAYVLGDGRLALVLEDTPESGAVWAIERIRRTLGDGNDAPRMWAGIACYPAHGMDADEIMTQSTDALARAREWPQDRIEVAVGD